jgi:glycosyltransferase involved in cell wall biosynthesis
MPQQVAGTEVYTWALAKSLQKKGNNVTIVIPNYNCHLSNEYFYDGLTIRQYAEPNNIDKRLRSGKRPPDGIGAFEKLIKDIEPDIVHVQELAGSSGIGIYHLRLLKKMKVKIIFTMHLARYSCFSGTLMYKNERPCSGLIDIKRCTQCALSKVSNNDISRYILYKASMPLYNLNINTGRINHSFGTALSYPFIVNNLRNSLLEIVDLCEKVVILTDWYKEVLTKNGVPENKICLVKQALPFAVPIEIVKNVQVKTPVKLIFIGRIGPVKGLHLLLEAIQDISEDKITLDIFGAVNDEKYFETWKTKTEAKPNIRWKDLLPQKEVVSTMRQYHALVLPSTVGEMSPLVIQEAFAAGVPVIGSNVAGIAEQIKDRKNGLLFEFNNVLALKNVLLLVLDNPAILDELKENIVSPGSFEIVVDEMIQIYENLLKDKMVTEVSEDTTHL